MDAQDAEEKREAPRCFPSRAAPPRPAARVIARQTSLGRIPDVPARAHVLNAVFNLTRSKWTVDEDSLPAYLGLSGDLQQGAPANVVRMYVKPDEASPDELAKSINLSSLGERPDLIKFVFQDIDGNPVGVLAPEFAAPGGPLQEYDPLDPAGLVEGPEDLVEERLKHLQKLPDGLDKMIRKYFYELDIHTNEELWSKLKEATTTYIDSGMLNAIGISDYKQIGNAMRPVMRKLEERVKYRVDYWGKGWLPAFPKLHPLDPLLGYTQLLSALLLTIGKQSGLSGSQLEQAFERFASGDLRVQSPSLAINYQPNSGYFFFFGEFALLAVQNDIDPGEWSADHYRRSWIRNQPVFAESYRGNAGQLGRTIGLVQQGIPKGFWDYGPDTWTTSEWDPWMKSAYDDEVQTQGHDWYAQHASENAYAYLSGLPAP